MTKRSAFFNFQRYKYPVIFVGLTGVLTVSQLERLHKRFRRQLKREEKLPAQPPEYISIDVLKSEELRRKFEVGGPITNELYRITQLYLWISAKFRGSELYETVFSWHQNLAWKYLGLAKDDNPAFRHHGVRSLALMTDLTDATCRQIAQASDFRTAVGVARTRGGNTNLLLDAPGWPAPVNRNELLQRLHEFMLKMDREYHHPCLQFVIAKTFAEWERGFDDDLSVSSIRRDVIPDCVNAILHHSWLPKHCNSIVNHGGLALLVDVYKLLGDYDKLDCLIAISRILSNISMHPECHNQLYRSGCIKILAKLLTHNDVRVSVPAGRALINCDADATGGHFGRNVYALHPVHRPTHARHRSPKVDAVFIHGLLGSAFVTWRQKDANVVAGDTPLDGDERTQCWPRDWLPLDCPEIRVLGINYDTNISLWAPSCPIAPKRPTLTDRSANLLDTLKAAQVGTRPIVWVAHSMGGLIVKHLLVRCWESSDPEDRALLERTAGVIFFSTPHRGSRLASLSPATQIIIWPTIEVQELRQNSAPLLDLHAKFLSLTQLYPIKVLTFAERLPTFVKTLQMELHFVDDQSSYIEVGELHGMQLDHLCICKPATRQSFLYRKVVDFVQKAVGPSTQVMTRN